MFSLIGKLFTKVIAPIARGVASSVVDAVEQDDTSFLDDVKEQMKDCCDSVDDSKSNSDSGNS